MVGLLSTTFYLSECVCLHAAILLQGTGGYITLQEWQAFFNFVAEEDTGDAEVWY